MYRPKILVVDDSEEWRELITIWLRQKRYRVRCAPDGPQAISLAERFRPDCLVLDFNLGAQTAPEVCLALKGRAQLAPMPIVILTCDASEKIAAYTRCKADHFVLKSAGPDELIAVIEAVLRRRDWDAGILQLGDLELVPKTLTARRAGRVVARLSPEQFSFLYLLVQSSPNFVANEELCKAVLHKRYSLEKSPALRSLAHRLRGALGKTLARRIKNSKRLGWVYVDPTAQRRRRDLEGVSSMGGV